MKKACLACGDEIRGRADKKFCSDQCRNVYNNALNRDNNNYIRNINNTLRKNRRILEKLNTEGKTKVHKDRLLGAGFDFNYHTNTYMTKTGKTYFYCYDQGCLALDQDFYMLVIRQEYVK